MSKLLMAVKLVAAGAALGAGIVGMPIAAADDPEDNGNAADNGAPGNLVPTPSGRGVTDYSTTGDFYQKPGQQPGQYKLVNPSQGGFWACYNGVKSYIYAGNPMLPGAVMADLSTCA